MKIGLYSPYLDTASGGEKYFLTIAEVLSEKYSVDILLDKNLQSVGKEVIKERNESVHGLKLSKVNFIPAPLGKGSTFFQRFHFLKQYEHLFYLSDGSFFFSTAKNNIAHIQMPLDHVASTSKKDKFNLLRWKLVLYNSEFTKELVEKKLPIKGMVLYPPVNTEKIKPLKKKKQILTVGRFVAYQNPKKQDVMIKAFKEMVDEYELKDWSFHLAGGLQKGNEDFLHNLQKLAKDFQIYFHPNVSIEALHTLYGESEIYWHAMGHHESDPKKMEHFGISTVEAMSAGGVPIVINKGGQAEIVENEKCGLLWETTEELKKLTMKVINDEKLSEKLSKEAFKRSQDFSENIFREQILEIVK